MKKSFVLKLTTPGETVSRKGLVFLDVPAADGRLTVLPDHQPLACALKHGELVLRLVDGSEERHPVGPGAMTVMSNVVEIVSRRTLSDAPAS